MSGGRAGREEKDYGFLHDLKRDWATLRSLRGRALARYIWDYYKVPILVVICAVFIGWNLGHIIWEGQKPCRLRACVVLNTDDYCQDWFGDFTERLTADGRPGAVDVNYDQPFDYDNMYYYVMELEVMTTVSSRRMDVAVCGEDMYSYLLAINACLPLDEALPGELRERVSDRLVYSTANLRVDEDGQTHPEEGIDGYFALDLEGTAFEERYNRPGALDGEPGPLYAVVISNTEHLDDSFALLDALTAEETTTNPEVMS